MKKTMKLILVITVLTVAISCGNKTEKKPAQPKTEQAEEIEHASETVLRLNNGNLWQANSETTDGINNMLALMNSFTEKENLEAYTILKQNLEKEFGTIITKCTMKGEPHNQLHNFLIPMKPLFKGLESSNLTICKESYNTLNKHLLEYSNYFE